MHSRVRVLLHVLALVVFVGGSSIPAVDAVLLHHLNPADSPRGTHFEPRGASCHADACLAGFSAVPSAEKLSPTPHRVRVLEHPVLPPNSVRLIAAWGRRARELLPRSPPLA
ncbi:MAG: hypothetical protein H6R40_86 [Gemmatimonadetes bacterium]|nr:hypothetical protein [Gemmatimonadota bacterium]